VFSLEHLHKKIKTAQDLLSVVKTMKALAAVNIRQYERAAESLEEYNAIVDMGWQILFHSLTRFPHAKITPEAIILVLGSDQGMCGRFNEIILEQAVSHEHELAGENISTLFWTVGERIKAGIDDLAESTEHYALPGSMQGILTQAQLIVRQLEFYKREKGIDTLFVIHNRLANGGGYHPVKIRLLPLDQSWLAGYKDRRWPGPSLPMIGLAQGELFSHLFHHYLFASLYRAFVQSMASENAARLASMQAAEKNIMERQEELQAQFRETRQSTITAELFDIVAGFEALIDNK